MFQKAVFQKEILVTSLEQKTGQEERNWQWNSGSFSPKNVSYYNDMAYNKYEL